MRRRAALLLCLAACTGTIEGPAGGSDPGGDPGSPLAPDVDSRCPAAPSDLRVAEAALDADGATRVTLAWSRVERATGYRVERGSAGAWTDIGRPDAAVQTFADPEARAEDTSYRVVAVADGCDEQASAPVPVHAVAATEYAVPDRIVPSVPFTVTLAARVRYPRTRSGSSPLILVLHGNHGICRGSRGDDCPEMPETGAVDNECPLPGQTTVPNGAGYDYLLDTLAAQGYVAVSIDGNAFNCRPSFIAERAQLLVEHLRLWKSFASGAGAAPVGPTFSGAVDLSKVGLLGHSRGGAAVSMAPAVFARAPIAGVTIASVFALAPTSQEAPRPIETAYAVLVPTCDADVFMLDGIATWDTVRHVGASVPRSQIALIGGNHNFFNTEWTVDDNDESEAGGSGRSCTPDALIGGDVEAAADAQQAVLELAAPAWFDTTLRGAAWPPFLRGEAGAPPAMSAWAGTDVDLRTSYVGPSREIVDDFASEASPGRNRLGQVNTFDGFEVDDRCGGRTCDEALGVCEGGICNGQVGRCDSGGCDLPFQLWHIAGDVSALALSWSAAAAATFALGDLDVSARTLSFRLALADAEANPAGADAELAIRVTDGAGVTAEVPLSSLARVRRMYTVRPASDLTSDVRPPKEILQTVRVTAAQLHTANPDLDLAHIAALEIATDPIAAGAVVVADVLVSK